MLCGRWAQAPAAEPQFVRQQRAARGLHTTSQLSYTNSPVVSVLVLVASWALVSLCYSAVARLGRRTLIIVAAAATLGATALLWFPAWQAVGSKDLFVALFAPGLVGSSLFAAPAVGVLWRWTPSTSLLKTAARGAAAACAISLGLSVLFPLVWDLVHAL